MILFPFHLFLKYSAKLTIFTGFFTIEVGTGNNPVHTTRFI